MTEAEREEKERIKREKIRKFESPLPFVLILRNLIFGKKKPDIYTRIAFYVGTVISLIFLLWNGITYYAIVSRDWILSQKGIRIESIIEKRGHDLEFESGDFLNRLQVASALSLILWTVFFVGLVFLYRKKKIFIYLTMVPLALYIMMSIFYLSFTYFSQDTTMFDKIALLVLALILIVHSYLMGNERKGGSISFFGESQEEDDSNNFE
ncbi:MAG: hypothetical protein HRT57_15620 [Crocinitomicaceae bacterium]|nr:hypothetical protein [Crocinitomicaceae bacterium]